MPDGLAWLREFTVAAAHGREIDNDRSGLHVFYGVAANQQRSSSSGNLRRRNDDSGSHEQRKHSWQMVGGEDHSVVTRYGSHRREHIHGLGARNARNQFHGEQGSSALDGRKKCTRLV